MTSLWPQLRGRLSVRLRAILVLVATVAVGLGLYMEGLRREEVRRRLAWPIVEAAGRGNAARVRELLDQGADVDSVTNGRYPWTPLMHAAHQGHTDVVQLLLERGADPNHLDLDFYGSLTLAADAEHWDVVRILVEHGADPSQGDGQSRSALNY